MCGDMLPRKGAETGLNSPDLSHFECFSEGGNVGLARGEKSPKRVFNHLFVKRLLRGEGKRLVFRLFGAKIGVWYTD